MNQDRRETKALSQEEEGEGVLCLEEEGVMVTATDVTNLVDPSGVVTMATSHTHIKKRTTHSRNGARDSYTITTFQGLGACLGVWSGGPPHIPLLELLLEFHTDKFVTLAPLPTPPGSTLVVGPSIDPLLNPIPRGSNSM